MTLEEIEKLYEDINKRGFDCSEAEEAYVTIIPKLVERVRELERRPADSPGLKGPIEIAMELEGTTTTPAGQMSLITALLERIEKLEKVAEAARLVLEPSMDIYSEKLDDMGIYPEIEKSSDVIDQEKEDALLQALAELEKLTKVV